jgi:hypothetical protein
LGKSYSLLYHSSAISKRKAAKRRIFFQLPDGSRIVWHKAGDKNEKILSSVLLDAFPALRGLHDARPQVPACSEAAALLFSETLGTLAAEAKRRMKKMGKKDPQLAPDTAAEAGESAGEVVSANGCTGLIPAPPEDGQQAEAYTDLYPIPEPAAKKAEKAR